MSPSATQALVLSLLSIAGTAFSTGGKVFYVNSTSTNKANSATYGTTPDAPFSTVNYAIGKCSAGRGDLILVANGHVETVSTAGYITANVAGVRIIGLGFGRNRPVFTWGTSTAATILLSAANVSIENCVFDMTGIDAVVTGFTVSAAGCSIRDCEIEVANAAGQAVAAITTTAGADRFTLLNNFIHGSLDAGCTCPINLVGGDSILIENNLVFVAATTTAGVIANATTDSTNLIIRSNVLFNRTAASTKVIVLTAASTGLIVNNRLCILSGAAPVTGAAMNVAGNIYSAAAGITAGTASTI